MKYLFLMTFFVSFFVSSQDIIIRSSELDSLIWKKINEYRISINEKACSTFDRGEMMEYGKRVTEKNALIKVGAHSDSVGLSCNGECLFQIEINGTMAETKKKINDPLIENFEYLADQAVSHWINSSSHEAIISYPTWTVSTVTSKIIISDNGTRLRMDCSYHCKKEDFDLTKKGKN